MVTKKGKAQADDATTAAKAAAAQLSDTVKASAQQIWLAGLGAFSKAQQEGGKVFETLVSEGVTLQRKTQAAAEEKLTEATARMAGVASGLSSKAAGPWDKLETIFEDRVSRALKKLGVPTSSDLDALLARVERLERRVKPAAKAVRKTARKTVPRK